MNTEKMKATKILEELIDYFFRNNVTNMKIALDFESNEIIVHVKGSCPQKPDDFDELYDVLNSPRQPEIEEYYFELLGGNDRREELGLLGSLVDSALMSYENGMMSIKVTRKL
ncbi:hypothetical protein [Alkalibacter saccharofermentans]|uniref:Uncharacterized protein n=1 Tax=Alkalibacter saccharofermentans DSM 14828 TaxID=1120975 RepID=A0A1M4U1I0_9FIRM|nr:hypothetical protein [Alkalibacter saccharofermentans]SHE50520.1 hypothetical protein SAMN02746064_00608 [Alkalibacter saccharofermentans DSM 14828]